MLLGTLAVCIPRPRKKQYLTPAQEEKKRRVAKSKKARQRAQGKATGKPRRGQAVGVLSGKMADVRSVAVFQKMMLFGILSMLLLYLGIIGLQFVPGMFVAVIVLCCLYVVLNIAVIVFVIMLAIKTSGGGVAVAYVFMTCIPFVNLAALLYINQSATSILKANGISVGFMGADMSGFPKR